MAAYDLEEQEQLDELKTWWKMYGHLVTATVSAVAVAIVGWQGWNWWQRQQAAHAAGLYGGLQRAVIQKDAKQARDLAGELIDKYGRTLYASMGAILSAKINAESGELKTARAQLAWAADNGRDEAMRALARLRLAALLIDDNAHDEALKALADEFPVPFQARQAELKGDALAASGKKSDARAAYEAALAKLDAAQKAAPEDMAKHGAYRDLLQAKRDSLAGGAA